jgi:hypothetical protein
MIRQARVLNYSSCHILTLQVTGASVSTTAGQGGLTIGKFVATIKKGSSTDDNLFTITFARAFGLVPTYLTQPIDDDLKLREDGTVVPTKALLALRATKVSDGSRLTNAKFYVHIFGTPEIREGNYA